MKTKTKARKFNSIQLLKDKKLNTKKPSISDAKLSTDLLSATINSFYRREINLVSFFNIKGVIRKENRKSCFIM